MEGKKCLGRRWKRGIYRGPRNIAVGAEKRSDSRPSSTTACQSGTTTRAQNCAENTPKRYYSYTEQYYRFSQKPDLKSEREETAAAAQQKAEQRSRAACGKSSNSMQRSVAGRARVQQAAWGQHVDGQRLSVSPARESRAAAAS
jgi:hypothetical protein